MGGIEFHPMPNPSHLLTMDSGVATLIMISDITSYLKLRNPISMYCISHILRTKINLVVWTNMKH